MNLCQAFPKLMNEGYSLTSPATPDYNCIAWAVGHDDVWWWPDSNQVAFWPDGLPREETLEAFMAAFASVGYLPCPDGSLVEGFEILAIYVKGGKPSHAARQLADGSWSSKLGRSIDLTHSLSGLVGQTYGAAAAFMIRMRRS